MEFVHFLSSHMLDPAQGGRSLYRDMVGQALHAEALGYMGVGIPEHHLVNVLLIPSPLADGGQDRGPHQPCETDDQRVPVAAARHAGVRG